MKRQYKVEYGGVQFITDKLHLYLTMIGWISLLFVIGILSSRTFWICAAILAAAFIMKGC